MFKVALSKGRQDTLSWGAILGKLAKGFSAYIPDLFSVFRLLPPSRKKDYPGTGVPCYGCFGSTCT